MAAILGGRSPRCILDPRSTTSAVHDPDRPRRRAFASITYNQIAARSLERIGALSDGVFAIAMTLIVLEIRVPALPEDPTDAELAQALIDIGPRFITYLLSFLTLGIFWNGQHTQLNYLTRANRDLSWMYLLFLAVIALLPFTTSLLSEYLDLRLALGLYWLTIFLGGLVLLLTWVYAERAGLVREGTGPEVGQAIRRRIFIAQTLYLIGFLISLPLGTIPALIFIVLVQLNYAIAPRLGILHRI